MKRKFLLVAVALVFLVHFARGEDPSAKAPSSDTIFSYPKLAWLANADATPATSDFVNSPLALKSSGQLAENEVPALSDKSAPFPVIVNVQADLSPNVLDPPSGSITGGASYQTGNPAPVALLPPQCSSVYEMSPIPPTVNLQNKLSAVAGFAYIRPFWGNQGFNIAVPSGTGSGTLILGDARDVLHNFNFAPRVEVDYRLLPSGVGIRASGWAYNLSGTLDRTLNSPAGSASLHAQSALGLSAVNLPEATIPFSCSCCQKSPKNNDWIPNFVGDVSLGARYSSLTQSFDAIAMSGSNVANLHSDQSFSGLGVTGALAGYYPIAKKLLIYSGVRGSALFGTNRRDSTYATMGTSTTSSVPTVLTDNKSAIIPVGELDAGFTWGNNVGGGYGGAPPPLVFLSLAFTGQIWGNTAMISAASPPNFGSNALYLVGFVLTLGFGY